MSWSSVGILMAGTASSTDPETWSQRVSTAVAYFFERWTAPLDSLALAVLGLLAAIYVLARAWTRWLLPRSFAHLPASGTRRGLERAGACALALLAAVAFVHLLVGAPRTSADLGSLLARLVGVLVLALGAARVFAGLLASAFRVSVTARAADGKESPQTAAHVVALLNELGARSPQGAEYPRGTDVSALDTAALSALPTGAVAKILVGIVSVFLPRAPWEVSVDEESANRRETVQIAHNGRSVLAAVVDSDLLGLPNPPAQTDAATPDAATTTGTTTTVTPDLHRVTAAMVLAKLHEVHHLPGLGGATDGTSIGLQAVATTDFARDYDAAVPLLARAVAIDSGNLGAALALLHHRFRDATDPAELATYDEALSRLEKRLKKLEKTCPTENALLPLRARLNRVVAQINGAYASDRAYTDPSALDDPRELAEKLVKDVRKLLDSEETAADSRTVLAAIRRSARILMVVGKDATLEPPLTPLEHHQAGCHYATAAPPNPGKAVTHLRIAATNPELATWRAKDPQLARFRTTDVYRDAFPPEKGTFLTLPGVAEIEAPLTRLGITNERELLAHTPDALGPLLGLTPTTTARLLALARLVSRVPAKLHPSRFSIATWVVEQAQTPTTRSGLDASAGKKFAEMLDAKEIEALRAWIRGSGLPWRSPVADYLRAVR